MKRITIGRNPSCDIVIDNNMVSRNHALLNIYPSGKLEIVSMGTNGTKVRGNLISNGQRYPLKRGDDVTFAGTSVLDWSLVPDPTRVWKIAGCVVGGIAVIVLLVWGIITIAGACGGSKTDDGEKMEKVENPAPGVQSETAATPEESKTGESAENITPDNTDVKSDAKGADKKDRDKRQSLFPSEKSSKAAKSADKPADTKNAAKETKKQNNEPQPADNDEQEWGRH